MWKLGGRMYRKGTRNTFSSSRFLCFTQNGQINVTASPTASRPPAVLAPKGRTENPRKIFQCRIPDRSSKKNHSCLHIGNLAIPMHIPHVEIFDIQKRHLAQNTFTSRATVPGLGSSSSSGAEPSTAVGGPGIHQREGQEVHDNQKDTEEIHEFNGILCAQMTRFASLVEIRQRSKYPILRA